MPEPTALLLQQVSKSYDTPAETVRVVEAFDLRLYQGEALALMGPSGCGKSTILRMAGLVERPDAGNVVIDGTPTALLSVGARRRLRARKVGFVFQNDGLLEDFTAIENAALPLLVAGTARKEALERAGVLLRRMGLSGLENRLPSRLSGGERQRVAIARAVVADPFLLVADEPTGALDARSAGLVADLLRELVGSLVHCVLVATHDEGLASRLDRTLRLERRR